MGLNFLILAVHHTPKTLNSVDFWEHITSSKMFRFEHRKLQRVRKYLKENNERKKLEVWGVKIGFFTDF